MQVKLQIVSLYPIRLTFSTRHLKWRSEFGDLLFFGFLGWVFVGIYFWSIRCSSRLRWSLSVWHSQPCQFFTQYVSNDVFEILFFIVYIFLQCVIDHCLVIAPALGIDLISKPIDDFFVQSDCNARLAGRHRIDGPSSPGAEVVFFFQFLSPKYWERSLGVALLAPVISHSNCMYDSTRCQEDNRSIFRPNKRNNWSFYPRYHQIWRRLDHFFSYSDWVS